MTSLYAYTSEWHQLKHIRKEMKSIRIYFGIAAVCMTLLSAQTLFAKNIAELKTLCPEGKSVTVAESFIIEGVVVSDCRSLNVENNPNINHEIVDLSVNDATVYLQEADGSAGVKLRFTEATDNELMRFDRVSFDLKGCKVNHHSNPDRVTVYGLTFANVVAFAHGSADGVNIKQKFIDELQDSDIYTMVTLNDAEMVFKDGTYADIYDGYAQYVPGFPYNGEYIANLRMDGAASLMRDSRGNSIYMLVNTRCAWRRNGKGVFGGMGPVSGVIVYTPLRRYGGEMGRYSLRPVEYSDIIGSKKAKSPWKCLTGWKNDDSIGQALIFETLGEQTGVAKKGKKGDRVLNDIGATQGLLWTDSDSYIYIDNDLNGLTAAGRGFQRNGAIHFKGPTTGWYVFDENGKPAEAKSFYIQFSAKKAKGTVMQFSFAWIEGDTDGRHNYNYPGEWKVEYSFDDASDWRTANLNRLKWTPVPDNATKLDKTILRSHPFWSFKLDGTKQTGLDCGIGMQQHSYNLPAEAFGKDNVVIRITPASDKLSAVRSNPSKNVLDPAGKPKPGMKNVTWIRFGNISVDYK